MNRLQMITSPKRKENISSSKTHLIEESDTVSEDLAMKSYENSGLDIDNSDKDDDKLERDMVKNFSESSSDESTEIKKLPSEQTDKATEMIPSESKSKIRKKTRLKSAPKEKLKMNIVSSSPSTSASDDVIEHKEINSDDDESHVNDPDSQKFPKIVKDLLTKRKTKESKKKIKKKNKEVIPLKDIPEDSKPKTKFKIIALYISHCDVLYNDLFLYGPFIKIYIVNYITEETLKLSTKDSKYSYSTKTFSIIKNKSLQPKWNELILIENELTSKMDNLSDIVILFEIVDKINEDENKERSIAWAFIKPIGHNSMSNMDKNLKLQLYRSANDSIESFDPFEQWKSKIWDAYGTCTLNLKIISVNARTSEDTLNEIIFELVQRNHEAEKARHGPRPKSIEVLPEDMKIEKKPFGECAKLPNRMHHFIPLESRSCNVLKFSRCGKYLAFSSKEEDKYFIIIYKIPECEEVTRLTQHLGIIYDICWNGAGTHLLSSSADCVAHVWNVADLKNCTKQKLSHDSYVYAGKFCHTNENILATGSYDKSLRIWTKTSKGKFTLSEKLTGHRGHVNAICFSENIEMFFSGDSTGMILKWTKGGSGWVKVMEIHIEEFKGKVINDLIMLPYDHKMIVILRNSSPWSLHLASCAAVTCYKNGITNRYLSRGSISPCGTLMLEGNNIWITSSGELYAVYQPPRFNHLPIVAVDFHPHFDMAALTAGVSIMICHHLHEDYSDPNLGIDVCSESFVLSGFNNRCRAESGDPRSFKSVARQIRNDIHSEEKNYKNKEFKLWNLLRKMDYILFRARNGKSVDVERGNSDGEFVQMEELEPADPETKIDVPNESFTVDLADFYGKKRNREAKRNFDDSTKRNNASDSSSAVDTYTIEKEKPPDVKAKKVVVHEIEESSTMSSVRSLEEDLNTYTVSPRTK